MAAGIQLALMLSRAWPRAEVLALDCPAFLVGLVAYALASNVDRGSARRLRRSMDGRDKDRQPISSGFNARPVRMAYSAG